MMCVILKNSSDVFNWLIFIFFDSVVLLEVKWFRNCIGCFVCYCKCDKFCKNYLFYVCIWGFWIFVDFFGVNDWRYNEIYGFIYFGVYIEKIMICML